MTMGTFTNTRRITDKIYWGFPRGRNLHSTARWNSHKLSDILTAFNFPKRKEKVTKRDVFCTGPLLDGVQLATVFPTSQEFVNKKMRFPVAEVLSNYNNLVKNFGGRRPAHEALRLFVEENFEEANEFEAWLPPDWSPSPKTLSGIEDEKLRTWAFELNTIWKALGRRVSYDVVAQPDLYSLIPIPHSFILPNAKCNEFRYWDAFWTLRGLLVCGMTITAKDVLGNLLHLVKELGYIPKGNRIYYEGRSNPPMLAMMMETYLDFTMDFEFIRKNIELVERELDFWKMNRTTMVEKNGIVYEMYRYNAEVKVARPEAYREDMDSGTLFNTVKELEEHFNSVQSASESGWSFSTRWFILHGLNHGNRTHTSTQYLIPVDLNSFMHRNYTLMKRWYRRMGNKAKERYYWVLSEELLTAIENVLWNEEMGIWQDYDVEYDKLRNYFYLSNFTPLWTKSYRAHPDVITEKMLHYLEECNMDKYAGGLPASTEYSGEIWDFPNSWSRLNYFFVKGLDKTSTPVASELAFHFAEKFIQSNYIAYNEHGTIFQTYDCLIAGRYGAGFEAMEASSTTLGVIFDLFLRWGSEFSSPEKENGFW